MKNTNIEWCDHSWSPWYGCTKVSPGCANCYAEHLMDRRMKRVAWMPVTEDNLPPLDDIVWLYDGDYVWVGGRAYEGDSWLWGNTYGNIWHNGQRWDGDLETDDDYKPTHWMRLPEPPMA